MAKSPVGGSRAYLKGRIGSDVYTLGKDGKGKRQQVVRSLAEQVSNPRTQSQMFGRMIMSTIAQAAKALSPIIDHSFDGKAIGQPSISEFTRRNYALMKADAITNHDQYAQFGLNKYQEAGWKGGKYIISSGPVKITQDFSGGTTGIEFAPTSGILTISEFRKQAGIGAEGYVTYIACNGDGKLVYFRVHVKEGVPDETTITAENAASLFDIDSPFTVTVAVTSSAVKFTCSALNGTKSSGIIATAKRNGAWVHSTSQLANRATMAWVSDVALPTYPTGTAQYLNGGDL